MADQQSKKTPNKMYQAQNPFPDYLIIVFCTTQACKNIKPTKIFGKRLTPKMTAHLSYSVNRLD